MQTWKVPFIGSVRTAGGKCADSWESTALRDPVVSLPSKDPLFTQILFLDAERKMSRESASIL